MHHHRLILLIWGRVPRNPIQVTNAFSNDPEDRPFQDVGFDGLGDEDERLKRQADYLNQLLVNFGARLNCIPKCT